MVSFIFCVYIYKFARCSEIKSPVACCCVVFISLKSSLLLLLKSNTICAQSVRLLTTENKWNAKLFKIMKKISCTRI